MELFTESKYSECYIHYRPQVMAYIRARISHSEDAEDLTQDVFEQIWRCRNQVRIDTLQNLVYTVMRNTVVDYKRRHYVRRERVEMQESYYAKCCGNTVEEEVLLKELKAVHNRMVSRLPEKRRQVYSLYFYKGMSYASIARELSLSERTVGGHLMWAYRSVRMGLDEIYHYNIG